MRRTRARLLASAVVILTAGVASAAFDVVVENPTAGYGRTVLAAGGDAGIDDDSGSDAPTEGGMDAPTEGGMDAPTEGGMDAMPDTGSDAGLTSIYIVESSVAISGPPGTPATATATVDSMNGGSLGSASISSSDSSMKLSYCGLTTCGWSPAEAVPYPLTVECVPGTGQTTGTLTVFDGTSGIPYSTSVTCTGTGSGPVLDVNPTSLGFGTLPVGQTASQMVYVQNTGFGLLDNVVIDLGATPNASSWEVSACTPSAPCSFGAGAGTFVTITFQPTSHGQKNIVATVTSNGGSDSIALAGTGAGGVMSVVTPPAPMFVLDIGTIPRNQPFSRDIVLGNTGNAPYSAMTTTPAAPYTIAPGPHQVQAMSTQNIAVTCMSATPTPTDNPQMITLSSADAYQGSPASVLVKCKVADTQLQIMPTMFDFGERRIHTPEPSIDITLTNPATSGAASQITSFALRNNTPGLTLTSPALPFSIAPGSSAQATLTLSTAADTLLDGELIDITVDGTPLQFPVTGKVVTPHSRVVPVNMLDLGTACVGAEVSGNVMLINDGTATLAVEPPVMDQSFVASAPGAPGSLPAGMSLTAAVTPQMNAMGSVAGTLTWRDDVPSEHEIGVVLDYVATGTALSPRGLDFGVVPVDIPGGAQYIKLQNCDLTPTRIKLESLKTKQGTLGAWIVEPRVGYSKELAGKEQQAVSVTFEPPARGRYEADLTVQTASGKQIVHLVGDATGRDWDNTSFYACACTGPGAPSRGWPIIAAIAIVIFRRRPPRHRRAASGASSGRRGSSSAR